MEDGAGEEQAYTWCSCRWRPVLAAWGRRVLAAGAGTPTRSGAASRLAPRHHTGYCPPPHATPLRVSQSWGRSSKSSKSSRVAGSVRRRMPGLPCEHPPARKTEAGETMRPVQMMSHGAQAHWLKRTVIKEQSTGYKSSTTAIVRGKGTNT